MVRKHTVCRRHRADQQSHLRATGVTNFLESGGALQYAKDMAAHVSPRTTKVHDRRKEKITQD
jgi:hypothetical protein